MPCSLWRDGRIRLCGNVTATEGRHITEIILCDQNVTATVRTDASHFTDFEAGRVKVVTVSTVSISQRSINKDVNDATSVNVQKLAAFVGCKQVTSIGQRPDAAHAI